MVKRLDAMYQTNSRGADWIKVKPEYVLTPFLSPRSKAHHLIMV